MRVPPWGWCPSLYRTGRFVERRGDCLMAATLSRSLARAFAAMMLASVGKKVWVTTNGVEELDVLTIYLIIAQSMI